MSESETDIDRATQRMQENDATLRALRIVWPRPLRMRRVVRFACALAATHAPIAELALRHFPSLFMSRLAQALETTRAPLRVFRLCAFRGSEHVLAWFIVVLHRHHRNLRRIVMHSSSFGDATRAVLHAFFGVSAEQEAVLRAIGQYAARIVRPLVAPELRYAQILNCACDT
jgi:hypothetical protein